ncbi:diguanylate cyclase domain-containing protein [Aliidiomarina sp. Khilg15.8]
MAVPSSVSNFWIPADLPDNDSERLDALNHMGLLPLDAKRSLTWQAVQSLTYDPLTKLPGSRLFEARIQHLLQASDNRFAVIMINCQRFRLINEIYGKKAADAVLLTVTRRLQRLKQPSAFVARLRDDRFGILLSKAHQHLADEFIRQLTQALDRPMRYKGHHYRLGFGIGINWRQQGENNSASHLLLSAEEALRSAGRRAQNTYVSVYEQPVVTTDSHTTVEDKFATALRDETLSIQIRPTLNMRTQQVYHYHAFATWQDNGEDIPAETLHGVAERAGLMPQLTEYVLKHAIKQFAAAKPGNAYLCVKLSHLDLTNTRLTEMALKYMQLHGMEDYRLQLELNDDNNASDWHAIVNDLFRLSQAELVRYPRRQAITSSGPDVGVLQVNKTYLLRRTTMLRALDNLSDMQMLKASVDMARSLGIDVMAEGIDSSQLRDCALELGILCGSGPLFGEPVPLNFLR